MLRMRTPVILGLVVLASFALALGAGVLAYQRAYDYFANELNILPEIWISPGQ